MVLEQLYNGHIAGTLMPQNRTRLRSYVNQFRMCRCLKGTGIIIIIYILMLLLILASVTVQYWDVIAVTRAAVCSRGHGIESNSQSV